MSSAATIHSAEANIDNVQTALSAVKAGLETAEAVAEAVDEARRSSHVLVKLTLVVAIVAIVALVVRRRRSSDEN
jgi:hypothetical protein